MLSAHIDSYPRPRAVLLSLGILILASIGIFAGLRAWATPSAVQWIQPNDFVYSGTSTDQQDLTNALQSLRTSVLYGQYHGRRQLSAIPVAPPNGHIVFDLLGYGPVTEDTSGTGKTPTGVLVTTYPDAGYVVAKTDGGPNAALAEQLGTATATDGGAIVTFGTAFFATPICTLANQTAADAIWAAPTTTTLTIHGTVNTNDVIAYDCKGNL